VDTGHWNHGALLRIDRRIDWQQGPTEPTMEADVHHLLIAEIDRMITRASKRAEQHGMHIITLRGEALRQRQRALDDVQRSLERLRTYRRALAAERRPGTALG
jgi:hypothetical protein